MANKDASARAERIIKLLPKIMSSITHWHHDRLVIGFTEDGQIDRPLGDVKMEAAKGVKVTFNQYQALTMIHELGECSVNELAAKLRLAQSTTSQLVDRLVKAGFVNRETFADDRRRIVVTLSKSGTLMMERRKQSLLQSYERILSTLDENDQQMLEDAFDKFYLVASKLNQSAAKEGG